MDTEEPVEPDVRRWTALARQLGFSDFLSASDGFRLCADQRPWTNARRPGIYFWLSQDGEAYVGQSVQPRARLHQHQKAHGDVLHAAFQPCAREQLNDLEAQLVERAGEHFPLRNIKLAVSTATEVPFDQLVSPEEQRAFVRGADSPNGEWRSFEQLERLQRQKFARFVKLPLGREAIEASQLFISCAIPKPAETEVSFWSATLLAGRMLVRVNVGQQEVFTFEADKRRGRIRVLTTDRVSWLRSWRSDYQTRSYVTEIGADRLPVWLTGPRLVSCRRLVVQLMRHTQALNSGSHCPQVVRAEEY